MDDPPTGSAGTLLDVLALRRARSARTPTPPRALMPDFHQLRAPRCPTTIGLVCLIGAPERGVAASGQPALLRATEIAPPSTEAAIVAAAHGS
ncbi:hypothetical protein [Acidimicrobium ferrooxidans]|uniref:hypothetical protein n=1 Tax=Acidimicrobium ferrooxidans TaxID=53635 RepID=UPI00019DE12F|nr:hypothetical protein [Acidimicrobium ferrooxidans]